MKRILSIIRKSELSHYQQRLATLLKRIPNKFNTTISGKINLKFKTEDSDAERELILSMLVYLDLNNFEG